MEHQTRQEAVDYINDLCQQAECKEKTIKVHQAQYVDRGWHPHPPSDFVSWWSQHKNFQDDRIDSVRAYNCKNYRDEYREGKGQRYDLPPGEGRKLSKQEVRQKFSEMVKMLAKQFEMKIEVTVPEEGFTDPLVK